MPLKPIIKDCAERMDKSLDYLSRELRGIRTGRATTALVEYVKVDYYGSPTDLRDLAQITVPEPTQIVIKPFDPASKQAVVKAIETADLGFNPMSDGSTIRINVPAPSADRRKQLVGQVKKMAEDGRVAMRNERRDAMKQIDQQVKDKTNNVSEDAGKGRKTEVDDLTKDHIARVDDLCDKKCAEVEQL